MQTRSRRSIGTVRSIGSHDPKCNVSRTGAVISKRILTAETLPVMVKCRRLDMISRGKRCSRLKLKRGDRAIVVVER